MTITANSPKRVAPINCNATVIAGGMRMVRRCTKRGDYVRLQKLHQHVSANGVERHGSALCEPGQDDDDPGDECTEGGCKGQHSWEPRKKLLNTPDESLYCLDALWGNGVVQESCSRADFRRTGRNYLSVHCLRLESSLLKSVRNAPNRNA